MNTDVAIVGGGPGGTSTALRLSRLGIRATLIEKASFPRYHIGESLTGECGNCLRSMGLEERMLADRHPIKWGVKVYGPSGANSFWVPVMGRCPERGLFEAFTWQVRRDGFDKMLLDTAAEEGASILVGEAVEPIRDNGTVRGVRVRTAGGAIEDVKSEVLVDASGTGTFLAAAGLTSEKCRGKYDNQVAVFSQVEGAVRDPGKHRGDTLIFFRAKNHWAWFIPLDDEMVSVGVVTPASYFQSRNQTKRDFLIEQLHSLNPELKRRLPKIKLTEPVRAISNYSYHIKQFTGRGFLCVGDSHRFIDPVFSFGVFFSMKEAEHATSAVDAYLKGKNRDDANPFADYQRLCEGGMNVIQNVIDGFWDHPYAFALFVHNRYTDDFIDLFAGRVYVDEYSPGLKALRTLNERGRKGAAFPLSESA